MGKLSFEQMMNFSSGSSGKYKFFKLNPNEEVRVRFLYDQLSDVSAYLCHSIYTDNKQYLISCARGEDDSQPLTDCKWCAQNNRRVSRAVVPVYNIDKNEIQYWTNRTKQFIEEKFVELFKETLSNNQPIASQVYKVKRTGEGLKTTYTITPTGPADGSTKAIFGDVETDMIEAGFIKPTDYEIKIQPAPQGQQRQPQYNTNYGAPQNIYQQPQMQQPQYNPGQANIYQQPQGNGYTNGYNPPPATRRTTDVF